MLRQLGKSIGPVARSRVCLGRTQSTLAEAENRLLLRSNEDTETVHWMQDLLNKTEGGGYLVSKAGLLAHHVAWGDHDEFGHVNNVMYLKWFETARVNWLVDFKRHDGTTLGGFMSGRGVGPIVRSVNLAWRYPVRFQDKVTVLHKLLPITEPDRFSFDAVVVSHKAKKVAARIREVIVTVDYDNKGVKTPIPRDILDAFNERIEDQNSQAPSS